MALYIGDTLIAGNIDGQQLNNPFSLLDYKYSEYELSNASWLLSNGQWNSGAVYQSVYDLLLQIYNGTVTKAGVSVKLSTETYADTDFVLNTSDTTFRLPIKVKLPNSNGVAGNGMALGTTDGTHLNALANNSGLQYFGSGSGYGQAVGTTASGTTQSALKTVGVTTDPTKSGIEVKDDSSMYLYFYVGETVQDANIIAAAGVLTDVADLKNASNFSSLGKETVVSWGMPDYSRAQTISTGTFTPSSDSIIEVFVNAGNNGGFTVNIGSSIDESKVILRCAQSGAVAVYGGGQALVLAGQTYSFESSSATIKRAIIAPLKGV